MARHRVFVWTWVIAFACPLGATGDDTAPADDQFTPEAIAQAISNLGHPRFVVREQASAFLWSAGEAAEADLEEALGSNDAEVVRRAEALLAKFHWGIYPDTPPEIVEIIEQFRDGNSYIRQESAKSLMQHGRIGYRTFIKLLPHVENERDRLILASVLVNEARRQVPDLIARGSMDAVEDLLQISLLSDSNDGAKDFAAFRHLAGTVEPAIAQYTGDFQAARGEEKRRLGRVLVHLYRTQGDWGAARQTAESIGDEDLVDALLWEQGNWDALSKRVADRPATDSGNELGLAAAYHRLAGRNEELDATVERIQSQLNLSLEYRETVRMHAEALLLNYRPTIALNALREHRSNLAMLFDLYCAQLRYEEAFGLVDLIRGDDTVEEDERVELTLHRARMLGQLGETDAARQLFTGLIDDVNRNNDWDLAGDLIQTEARLGMKDLALAHAAEVLVILAQRDGYPSPDEVLRPIFGDRYGVAETLWLELGRKYPELKPHEVLERVRNLLDGKAGDNLADWIAGIDQAGVAPAVQRWTALGEVYLAAEDLANGGAFLQKAAEREPSADLWMRIGDVLGSQDRFREAAERYALAWELGQSIPLPLFMRGVALARAGDVTEGRRFMELAHWLPLGNEPRRAEFADALAERGFTDEALREAELVRTTGWYRYWQVGNILNRLGRRAIAEGRYHDAARLYEKSAIGCMKTGALFVQASAYLTVPQSVIAYEAQGFVQEGKFEEAEALIQQSLQVLPGNMDLVIAVVPELDKAGRSERADELFEVVWKTYEGVCSQYPNSAWAHNSSAWVAANCQRELDAALAHAEQAVKLSPESAGYLDTLAEVRFRRGEQEQAIDLMQHCIEMEPSNAYFQRQLERFRKGDINTMPPEN